MIWWLIISGSVCLILYSLIIFYVLRSAKKERRQRLESQTNLQAYEKGTNDHDAQNTGRTNTPHISKNRIWQQNTA